MHQSLVARLGNIGKIRKVIFYPFTTFRSYVYHSLQHLSGTGKVLYKEGTEEYQQWQEATKWELLESGFEKIAQRLDKLEKEVQDEDKRESLRKLRGYLDNHNTRLCYRERLSEGRVAVVRWREPART